MAQYSTVQYSTVRYSTVHYGTVQYIMVQYSTAQSLNFYFTVGNKCAKGQKVKSSKFHRGPLKVRLSQEHISSELVF